jgi:peptidoglycan hydrolase-like protein with peptidoglycan-binding domain
MLALGADIVADGHFGRKSAIALREFQRRNDLVPDGILGPVSWKATFEKPLPPTE